MRRRRLYSTVQTGVAVAAVAALSLTGGGCQSSDCLDLRSAIPIAAFYVSGTEDEVALDSLSVGGVNAPNDSLLVKPGAFTSSTYLPLRSTIPATSFYIHYGYKGLDSDADNDTITLTYESIPYFVSEECGAMYYYRITDIAYTRHLIDSIACRDSLVTNAEIERLAIYMRVSVAPDTPDTPDGPAAAAPAKGGRR